VKTLTGNLFPQTEQPPGRGPLSNGTPLRQSFLGLVAFFCVFSKGDFVFRKSQSFAMSVASASPFFTQGFPASIEPVGFGVKALFSDDCSFLNRVGAIHVESCLSAAITYEIFLETVAIFHWQ
jgi:hypothetical protein